jgi:hypothetical protein
VPAQALQEPFCPGRSLLVNPLIRGPLKRQRRTLQAENLIEVTRTMFDAAGAQQTQVQRRAESETRGLGPAPADGPVELSMADGLAGGALAGSGATGEQSATLMAHWAEPVQQKEALVLGAPVDDLQKKLQAAKLPSEVAEKAATLITSLEKMGFGDHKAVVTAFLNFGAKIKGNKATAEQVLKALKTFERGTKFLGAAFEVFGHLGNIISLIQCCADVAALLSSIERKQADWAKFFHDVALHGGGPLVGFIFTVWFGPQAGSFAGGLASIGFEWWDQGTGWLFDLLLVPPEASYGPPSYWEVIEALVNAGKATAAQRDAWLRRKHMRRANM